MEVTLEEFERLRLHPEARVFTVGTARPTAVLEHVEHSYQALGFLTYTTTEEYHGFTLRELLCVPAEHPSRKERGL